MPSANGVGEVKIEKILDEELADKCALYARVTIPAGSVLGYHEHHGNGESYFVLSGEAVYAMAFDLNGTAPDDAYLDLGEVRDVAEVAVNGHRAGAAWYEPFRVFAGSWLRLGRNTLEIRVANGWANRLIGDDRLYAPDCEWKGESHKGKKEIAIRQIPDWVKEGKASPTGRHTFTTWKHWSKEDDLLVSGLLGPVYFRSGVIAK